VSYFIIDASVSTCLAQWWFQRLLLSENRTGNRAEKTGNQIRIS